MRALALAVSLVFVVSAPSFASDDQSSTVERFRLEAATGQVGTIDTTPTASRPPAAAKEPHRIDWKPLLLQSLHATSWQQTFRLMGEPQSRQRLTQISMFRNWQENVKALDHWDDQGPPFVNYVAHPLMGAMSGRLLLNNDARGRVVRPGDDGYWAEPLPGVGLQCGLQHSVGNWSLERGDARAVAAEGGGC